MVFTPVAIKNILNVTTIFIEMLFFMTLIIAEKKCLDGLHVLNGFKIAIYQAVPMGSFLSFISRHNKV